MIDCPETIINMALRRIAYPTPVGSIYEGSRAARAAVAIYSQTRDDLLASRDWSFAQQEVPLTLLKTAPVGGYNFATPWSSAYPLQPWIYEYAYPTACVMLKAVRPTVMFLPEFDPKPHVFTLATDPTVTPTKVVLTNLSNAIGQFTAQATDPTQWEPDFIEALIQALAQLLGRALGDATQKAAPAKGEPQQAEAQ